MTEQKRTAAGLPYRPCVGILLINNTGNVWIGRRHMPDDDVTDAYRWQLPQGGIDSGETPEEAAMRELWEEVGTQKAEIIAEARDWFSYDLPPEMLARKRRNNWGGQRQKYFAMKFLGTDADVDLEVHHPEFDEWRWAELDELPGLIVPFKRPVYEQVVAEFRPLIEGLRG